ncbi:MAG: S9 family peptidase [Acidobacteria bacterium]|nr:S9 family peptidase [Acidobacteriota bacterium]
MTRRIPLYLAAVALAAAQSTAPRVLKVEDVHRVLDVRDPQVSPDGAWVAYTLSTIDKAAEKSDSDVWRVRWDGSGRQRLTSSKEGESSPRWSPDGKWLSFLSSRANREEGTQVWLLPVAGGEATQLTTVKGSVSDCAWSPDSKRLALVIAERDEEPKKEGEKPKTAKPIVIDRYHFKQDMEGYRTKKPSRIWLFDIEAKKAELLTAESLDESSPCWSPDGGRIAFVSNRAGDKGMYADRQLCVAEAKAGAAVRQVTSGTASLGGRGGRAVWSADGSSLYFLAGRERKFRAYDRMNLARIPAAGGEAALLTRSLGRSVGSPIALSDKEIGVLVTDDMSEYPVSVGAGLRRLLEAKAVINSQNSAAGHLAVAASTDQAPGEIFALENGKLRPLTQHNQDWLKEIRLGETREVRFKTRDSAEVHGLLTLPPDYQEGQRVPTLLRIHGGPNGQDGHAFQFERHLFAANGYAVLQVNYRGSAGRDEAFQTAIFADWGNKEVIDLLAGVDHVVAAGIADPARLGIGGWSYGGILTDYTIARDGRFKAAISGAGSAMQIAMYGSDQYVEQYDLEIGFPWKAKDLWLKISYPFFEAEKIRTPTLFLGGQSDFNVPIIGGEQMYQALKANGVETQLVVYPGENHGIRKPTYIQDRLERYLAWYAKYLK